MKKRLEADLISIAHRILKLKDRAEIDQLQQETLRLYEKLSVLKFVEDNFKGATPTIGHASALFKLEDVYGLNEDELVKPEPGELDREADEKAAGRKAKKEADATAESKEDKENKSGEGVGTDKDGKQPVATEEKKETEEETPAEDESKVAEDTIEEDTAEESEPKPEEEEAAEAEEPANDEPAPAEEDKPEMEEPKETPEVEEPKEEPKQETKAEEPKAVESHEEPEVKVQVEKPAEDVKVEEASAAAVYEKEHESTPEEEEKAADAEIKTIEPDANAKVEEQKIGFEFAFERPAAPETPAKQKELSFEDFHDYKEPEFIKKGDDAPKAATDANDWRNWQPEKSESAEPTKQPEAPKQEEPVKDWRDWEPTPSAPKAEAPKPAAAAAPKSFNDGFVKAISLGLNDRIAFEKNLFNGSSDDLNRVISQLNTFNSYQEAQNFIEDLVKPDYNNWKNKEEYEERFMVIVEKRFS